MIVSEIIVKFTDMKRVILICLALWSASAFAQRTGVREEVLSDWNKASGLDGLYDFTPKASTPAPKGYEAVYISHYGRHGSRYAYTESAYTVFFNLLSEGRRQDNLTPYGEALLERVQPFWDNVRYRVGDLTPIGWEQQQRIAEIMVKSFPTVFGKGSVVDACSSSSVRSILSMSSCCAALSRLSPQSSVYEHQGKTDIQATRPNQGRNIFAYKGPALAFPYPESSETFFLRHLPGYNDILARVFKDTDSCLGSVNPYDLFFNIYMLVAGQNSLPQEQRLDLSGLVTPQEFATLWEIDNYERFREYFSYRTPCSSIVDDMVEKADAALMGGVRGADLRFGHDHVLMALLMIMDIDDFDHIPEAADDLVYYFQTFRSPMSTNIQMVFFAPKKNKPGDVLVKFLLNGEAWNRKETCLIAKDEEGKQLKIFSKNSSDSARNDRPGRTVTFISWDGKEWTADSWGEIIPTLAGKNFTVDEDYYFLMGDHRNNSNDSRSVGAVERSMIIGHVRRVVFPFSGWRAVR